MGNNGRIVAHLIIGARPEPYLEATLASIAGVASHVVVNDNSGQAQSPNEPALEALHNGHPLPATIMRTKFADFARARNDCIDATPQSYRGCWALFVDADEVHGPELPAMGALLHRLPDDVEAVDGYSRHFVGSFRWWYAIERRLCFFRLRPDSRWQGPVHERLSVAGRRIALPGVWFHYGHVVTPQMEAEKGRLYRSLGQHGQVADAQVTARLTAHEVWHTKLRQAIAFGGAHPQAAHAIIDELEVSRKQLFAEVDRLATAQTALERMYNNLRALNYARLIGLRTIEAHMRWHWRPAERAAA